MPNNTSFCSSFPRSNNPSQSTYASLVYLINKVKMPSYSYSVAKSVLNEMDKNRFLCIYLHSNQSAIDWQSASRDYGCASVDSFRVLTNRALKKIADAGGRLGEGGVAVVPAPAAKKKRPRKRKTDFSDDTDSEFGGGKGKRKRGRPSKKAVKVQDKSEPSAHDDGIGQGEDDEGSPDSLGGV